MQQAVGPDYVISAGNLSVTASPNTRVLHLAYTGPSAKVARSAVSAAAASVLQQRALALQQENHDIVSQLNVRSSTISPALTELRAVAAKPVMHGALAPIVDELTMQLRRNNAFLTQASQVVLKPGAVSAPPAVRLDSDSRITDLADGLAIGVLLAAALVTFSFVRSQRLPLRRPTPSSRALPVLARGPSRGTPLPVPAALPAGRVHRRRAQPRCCGDRTGAQGPAHVGATPRRARSSNSRHRRRRTAGFADARRTRAPPVAGRGRRRGAGRESRADAAAVRQSSGAQCWSSRSAYSSLLSRVGASGRSRLPRGRRLRRSRCCRCPARRCRPARLQHSCRWRWPRKQPRSTRRRYSAR